MIIQPNETRGKFISTPQGPVPLAMLFEPNRLRKDQLSFTASELASASISFKHKHRLSFKKYVS